MRYCMKNMRGTMGKNIKSRGCWAIGLCMRGDCAERDKLCDTCIRFSNYRIEEVCVRSARRGRSVRRYAKR